MKRLVGFCVLAVLGLGVVSSLSSQTAPPPARLSVLDPFQCYTIKASRGNLCVDGSANEGADCESEEECGGVEGETALCVPNKFPKGLRVSLADRFQTGIVDVQKPFTLCNPATVDGSDPADPTTHLKGYQIKLTKGQCVDTAPQNAGQGCTREADCGGGRGTTLRHSPHTSNARTCVLRTHFIPLAAN